MTGSRLPIFKTGVLDPANRCKSGSRAIDHQPGTEAQQGGNQAL
jgi:hypothetical protein